MTGWEKPFGIFLLFFFCLIGFASENKKLKIVSWATGVIAAITLIGWSEGIVLNAQQFLGSLVENIKPDVFGATASVITLGLSQSVPSKSVRRTVQTTAASGLALSLFGVPMWIMWLITLIMIVCILVVTYFAIKRIAQWISALVRGS
jgi:uncharacterized membrane protein